MKIFKILRRLFFVSFVGVHFLGGWALAQPLACESLFSQGRAPVRQLSVTSVADRQWLVHVLLRFGLIGRHREEFQLEGVTFSKRFYGTGEDLSQARKALAQAMTILTFGNRDRLSEERKNKLASLFDEVNFGVFRANPNFVPEPGVHFQIGHRVIQRASAAYEWNISDPHILVLRSYEHESIEDWRKNKARAATELRLDLRTYSAQVSEYNSDGSITQLQIPSELFLPFARNLNAIWGSYLEIWDAVIGVQAGKEVTAAASALQKRAEELKRKPLLAEEVFLPLPVLAPSQNQSWWSGRLPW
jgi:hypothetical protein